MPCQRTLIIVISPFMCIYLFFHYIKKCLKSRTLFPMFMYSLQSSVWYLEHSGSPIKCVDNWPSYFLLDVQKINQTLNAVKVTKYIQGHWIIEKWHIILLVTLTYPVIVDIFKQCILSSMPVQLPFVRGITRLIGSLYIYFQKKSLFAILNFLKF